MEEISMGFLIAFLIGVVITAISLLIISKIPFLGIEVDDVTKALVAGVVIGILNWALGWMSGSGLLNVLTLGLLWLVVNTIVFGLSAKLVEGFRLRNGIISAILGAIALTFVNSVLFKVLGMVLPAGTIPAL
jgi:putative membrane protein